LIRIEELEADLTQLKDQLSSGITEVGEPHPYRARVLTAYVGHVTRKMDVILAKKPSARIDSLRNFLLKNWRLIKGTNLCYTALPTHEVTQLLIKVALFVRDNLKRKTLSKHYFVLDELMPGLVLDSLNETEDEDGVRLYPDLSELTELVDVLNVFKTHIIEETGRALIPVRSLLDACAEDSLQSSINLVYYDYHCTSMSHFLREDEKSRLQTHSSLTRAVWKAKKDYDSLVGDGEHLFGQLHALCKQLGYNSVRTAGGVGTESQAGKGVYDPIFSFYEYYRQVLSCDLIRSDVEPSAAMPLEGTGRRAYVCYDGALYHVNKANLSCERLTLDPEQYAGVEALLVGTSFISLSDDSPCSLLRALSAPSLSNLDSLLGSLAAAYVFYDKELYYLSKAPAQCHQLHLDVSLHAELETYLGSTSAVTLTHALQKQIEAAGHVHDRLRRVEILAAHENKEIPEEIKQEVDTLLELCSNQKINHNATETMATCIATRREELEQKLKNYVAELSAIRLFSGEGKETLLLEAKEKLSEARKDLLTALTTKTYRGSDPLYFNASLLRALDLEFSISLEMPEEELMTLFPQISSLELSEVFSARRLQEELINRLATLDNLVSFLQALSPNQTKVICETTSTYLCSTILRSGLDDMKLLLISMDKAHCRMICEGMKDELYAWTKEPTALSELLACLISVDSQNSVLDIISDAFFKRNPTLRALEAYYTVLTPTQVQTLELKLKTQIKRWLSDAASDSEERAAKAKQKLRDCLSPALLCSMAKDYSPSDWRVLLTYLKASFVELSQLMESFQAIQKDLSAEANALLFDAIKDKLILSLPQPDALVNIGSYCSSAQFAIILEAKKERIVEWLPTPEALISFLQASLKARLNDESSNHVLNFTQFYLHALISLVEAQQISARDILLSTYVREARIKVDELPSMEQLVTEDSTQFIQELFANYKSVCSSAAMRVVEHLRSSEGRRLRFWGSSEPSEQASQTMELEIAFYNTPLATRGQLLTDRKKHHHVIDLLKKAGLIQGAWSGRIARLGADERDADTSERKRLRS
jgi:hypothetical protein